MDNLALGLTKAITELLESHEKRSQEQRKCLSELERKVDVLEKTCTNLKDENNKLKEELTICKKHDEDIKLILNKNIDDIRALQGWPHVVTTIANQLNEMKDRYTESNSDMIRVSERIEQHHRRLNNIITHLKQQPPPPQPVHTYMHRVPRSLSSARLSHIERSSPLQESIDDEELSILSDQTENLKQSVDALNKLQRSFDNPGNYLYQNDIDR